MTNIQDFIDLEYGPSLSEIISGNVKLPEIVLYGDESNAGGAYDFMTMSILRVAVMDRLMRRRYTTAPTLGVYHCTVWNNDFGTSSKQQIRYRYATFYVQFLLYHGYILRRSDGTIVKACDSNYKNKFCMYTIPLREIVENVYGYILCDLAQKEKLHPIAFKKSKFNQFYVVNTDNPDQCQNLAYTNQGIYPVGKILALKNKTVYEVCDIWLTA